MDLHSCPHSLYDDDDDDTILSHEPMVPIKSWRSLMLLCGLSHLLSTTQQCCEWNDDGIFVWCTVKPVTIPPSNLRNKQTNKKWCALFFFLCVFFYIADGGMGGKTKVNLFLIVIWIILRVFMIHNSHSNHIIFNTQYALNSHFPHHPLLHSPPFPHLN